MKKIITAWLLVLSGVLINTACNNNKPVSNTNHNKTDSLNCDNSTTIKDPNNAKAMALNMRYMAAQADSIKILLLKGNRVDSVSFPFVKFYLSEPTDPNVLEPKFFENAKIYRDAYFALMNESNNQVKAYNAMIGACINCHQSYCSGPLKRIRKLPI